MKILKQVALAVALVGVGAISAALAQIIISPPAADIHINGHTYTNADWQANPAGTLSAIANDIGAITSAYPTGRFSPRVKLTANLDMYADAAGGSDSNNCLVGNPCQSVQRPFDLLRDGYDCAGYAVTVHLADGSYSPGLKLSSKILGCAGPGDVLLLGNEANPQNVVISDVRVPTEAFDSGIGSPILVAYGGALSVRGVSLVSGFRSAWAHVMGTLFMRNIRFGPAGESQVAVSSAGSVRFNGDYAIYGGAGCCHYAVYNGGALFAFDPGHPEIVVHVTITNSPAYPLAFASAQSISQLFVVSSHDIFTGAASGPRYFVTTNSLINTNGSGASFLPGDAAGIAGSGGIYQ